MRTAILLLLTILVLVAGTVAVFASPKFTLAAAPMMLGMWR